MAIYDRIPGKEQKFHTGLKDSYGKVHKAFASPTMTDAIRLITTEDAHYYKEETKKDKIVLHFTAGILHGDIGELTKHHVSVAYVVARDGTLYELFDPKYWSYHLGKRAVGGNTTGSKSSIGIEISNYGPLLEKEGDPDNLYTIYNKVYCAKSQTDAYVKLDEPFREHSYFATFTSAQYRTLDSLITRISRKHGILRKLPAVSDRMKLLTQAPGEGIWSHQNFRSDKLDTGPAFIWSKIAGR